MVGRLGVLCIVVTFALSGALLVAPSGAGAAKRASDSLVLEPAAPVAGERPLVSGRAPGPAGRLVRLQTKRADGTWRTIDRRTTRPDRTFSFRLDPLRAMPRRVRVVAERTDDDAGWRSRTLVVRGRAHTAELTLPPEAEEGALVVAAVEVSPARPGATVRVVDARGSVLGTASQDAAGRAFLDVVAPPAGDHLLRAEVPRARFVPRLLSPAEEWRTTLPVAHGVPRVDIVTEDGQPVTSKTAYRRAMLTLDPRGSGVPAFSDSVRLRVRGNFTSSVLEKRPYKLKLDDEPLLGLPESEDWVLLANYFDRSLLRTTVGMEISRRLERPWTPHLVDVEVWLNGSYQGVYQLGEGIEVEPGRVELPLDEEEDSPLDGGWTLEADKNPEDDPVFTTSRNLRVYVTEPGVNQPYADQVGAWVQEMEDVLYSPGFADPVTGYAKYLDTESFVDWYLVMELMKTFDAGFNNSIRMQRPVGGKLEMGPVWDFDLSAGNRRQWHTAQPEGWFVRTNWFGTPGNEVPFPASQMNHAEGHWIHRLFQDPAFAEAVRGRWSEVRGSLMTLPQFVADRHQQIAVAARRNFAPLSTGGAGHPLGASPYDSASSAVFHPTYTGSVQALQAWLTARLAWMDEELS